MSLRRVLLLADAGAVALVYTLWSARPLWTDVALAGVLLAAVLITWDRWSTAAPRGLAWPALAFLAAYALAAVCAPNQLLAWRSVLGVVAYALVFVLLGNLLAWGLTRSELYQGLVLTSQVLMAALAVNWLADGAHLFGYRLRFENTNSAALAVLLLLPALIAGERRRLVGAESAAVLWLSASRAGALGLAAGMGTAVLRGHQLRRYWPVLIGLALAVGLALAARPDMLSGNGREKMWSVAVRMAEASPVVGQGPNSYKGWWLAAGSTWAFGHAHNLYLNLLAETGALGLAAGAWLIGALLLMLARRRADPWALAGLAATVALLAHSLGDVPTTAPYITVTWLALVRLGLTETTS